MNNYELIVIISPQILDEDVTKVMDKISDIITNRGGTITELNQWGRRKLAYAIGKYSEGNYALTRFKLKPELTKEVKNNLNLSNEVIRHLLVKIPEGEKSEKHGKSE